MMETGIAVYKPEKAVDVRRNMARQPQVMAALSPVEKSVFLATTAKVVDEYVDNELAVEVAKALKFIAKDVGYRSTTESEMGYLTVRVCEILKRHYGGLTLRDFRMAFEMSITGELDEFLPKNRDGFADRNHYQNFNAEYVCKILNAYKSKRSNILKKAYDINPDPINDEKKRTYMNDIRQKCIDAFAYYKVHGALPAQSPIADMLQYEMLESIGLAVPVNVTDDDKQAVLQSQIRKLTQGLQLVELRHLKDKGTDAECVQVGAFELARRNALIASYARMAADGVVLSEHLKFE